LRNYSTKTLLYQNTRTHNGIREHKRKSTFKHLLPSTTKLKIKQEDFKNKREIQKMDTILIELLEDYSLPLTKLFAKKKSISAILNKFKIKNLKFSSGS
jgi:hypothetical protein